MIQLLDVAKTHRRGQSEVHALRGVTCEIPEHQFTFIIGPSGSGKSSLLYLIGALDEPTGGDIIVQGQRLSQFTRPQRDLYRRHKVGFVFQNFNLLNNLTAVENVLIPYLPTGEARKKRSEAESLLRRVGLGDRLDHRPSQLSGGEQQRIALVRALLKRPLLVLADEPTGELDSASGAEIFRYLRELKDEHQSTVIIVTHDRSYIQPGDNVLRIRDGKLAEQTPA
ncbi:MAG: ABC transporter ATP-binding protein [Planctomycetota bacterium]